MKKNILCSLEKVNIFGIWHNLQVCVIDPETNVLWFILHHEGYVLRLSVLLKFY